ncbi:Ureidoglycolate hydrolase [Quillaja saponaria]|uniref:Ureidoglycolate hydrolase n=1 Tax=Quillaja saponaria TaxID=32244 RepID=A0AAD7M5K3_QUISA|nr:Ureidoglycolate hydrolase [Quillaja saponaria]KAJ7970400.1 Ureidoglycolate hydrolase [Quillaja saponaria]
MDASGESKPAPAVVKLKPIDASPSTFKDYGQVIEPSPDGKEFGPEDAQLDLCRGTPRFYVMHLHDRPLQFSVITHHASVTQCLGSVGGYTWYLGVAKPSLADANEINDGKGKQIVQSPIGHSYVPPTIEDVQVFRIAGSKFLKFNRGTWHAGPLFKSDTMDFYNLELSNTNVIDHTPHDFVEKNGIVFSIDE